MYIVISLVPDWKSHRGLNAIYIDADNAEQALEKRLNMVTPKTREDAKKNGEFIVTECGGCEGSAFAHRYRYEEHVEHKLIDIT